MRVTPLNEVLAYIFVLRTLVVVWMLPPVLVFASPFVVGAYLTVLDYFTNGYGVLSTAGAFLLTLGGRAFIAAYAPSKKHRDDAFRKSIVVLPVLAFATFQFIMHFMLVPLSSAFGFKDDLTVTPKIPYLDTVKIAVSLLVLGLTVMLRYLGTFSVVRCSAFPVVSRPLTTSLRWILSRCFSLELLAAPSDTPGVLLSSPFSAAGNGKGRRYQGPPIQTGFMLIVVSLCFAVAAAWVVSVNSSVYLNAYCISVVSHLLITCLDGKSHELNPLRYKHTNMLASLSVSEIKTHLFSVGVSAILVPMFVFLQNLPSDEIPWGTMGYSLAVAAVTTLYLSGIDVMARTFLCSSGFSLQRLIVLMTWDVSPGLAAEVIVKCALFSNNELFDSVMKPTPKVGTNSLEEEELARSKKDAETLANVITTKSTDFGLPQDVLRVLILESFGGRDSTSVAASGRHEDAVKNLVSGTVATGRVEPLAVPVVRSLCAYVAGLGVALQKVSTPRNPKLPPLATPATFATWALPPGALSCSERALVGATRMIIQSITGPSSTNWRDTHLSMFVPVLLISAFQLRCGIEIHEKDLARSAHSPLLQVKQTCDACAVFLLNTLQATDSRIVELTIQQQDCRRWLGTLLNQSGGPVGSPPVLIRENDKPLASYNKRGFSLKYY